DRAAARITSSGNRASFRENPIMSRRLLSCAPCLLVVAAGAIPFVATSRPTDEVKALNQEVSRMLTRVLFFTTGGGGFDIKGEAYIDYGQPAWKPDYEAMLKEDAVLKRWRLGNDAWTTLDTNV